MTTKEPLEPPPRPMSGAFVKTTGLLLEEASLMIEKAERTEISSAAGAAVKISVSIGVATRTPKETYEALVERADRAMYEAKATGRNRVCVASTDEVRPIRLTGCRAMVLLDQPAGMDLLQQVLDDYLATADVAGVARVQTIFAELNRGADAAETIRAGYGRSVSMLPLPPTKPPPGRGGSMPPGR